MLIRVQNNLHEEAPKTYLSSAVVAAATVYPSRNTAGFTTSYAVQIGETGQEFSEVIIGTATNVGTITGAASNYAHPADTPIYNIKFNQVVYEKSTSGTGGTATAITDGTVTYQADSSFTVFDDAAGASTHAFRTRFRNSVLGSQTAQSDWITPAGFTFYSLAKLRERVKNKLWSSNYLTNPVIDDWINEWKDQMSNAVIRVNEDYAMGTVDIGFGTAGLGTVTISDFNQIRRFEVTYNGGDFYLSTKKSSNDFLPSQTFLSTHPYHNWIGDTIFQVRPPESGGTARLSFYRFGTTMVNDTDELPLPMRSFTHTFVDYVKLQAKYKDDKATQEDIDRYASREIPKFVEHIVPRDMSGPTMIDLVENITSDDEFWP